MFSGVKIYCLSILKRIYLNILTSNLLDLDSQLGLLKFYEVNIRFYEIMDHNTVQKVKVTRFEYEEKFLM